MRRRRGKHWTYDGRPKRAHPSQGAALAFANESGHEPWRKKLLIAYRCDECPHWHLGNERWFTNPMHDAERELMLLELGPRVTAHVLAENSMSFGPRARRIRRRALSAARKARQAVPE